MQTRVRSPRCSQCVKNSLTNRAHNRWQRGTSNSQSGGSGAHPFKSPTRCWQRKTQKWVAHRQSESEWVALGARDETEHAPTCTRARRVERDSDRSGHPNEGHQCDLTRTETRVSDGAAQNGAPWVLRSTGSARAAPSNKRAKESERCSRRAVSWWTRGPRGRRPSPCRPLRAPTRSICVRSWSTPRCPPGRRPPRPCRAP